MVEKLHRTKVICLGASGLQPGFPSLEEEKEFSRALWSLAVRLWFHAVHQASGLGVRALARRFPSNPCPARQRSEWSSGEDSGYWHKIRRGEINPLLRQHGRELIALVELAFPGTARWIRSPLWRLLDVKPITLAEIHNILNDLHPRLRDVLLAKKEVQSVFWRMPPNGDQYRSIEKIARPDLAKNADEQFDIVMGGLVAIVALIRESEIIQHQPMNYQGRMLLGKLVQRLGRIEEAREFVGGLLMMGKLRFNHTIYCPDGETELIVDLLSVPSTCNPIC